MKKKLLYHPVLMLALVFVVCNGQAQSAGAADTVIEVEAAPPAEESSYDEQADEDEFYRDSLRPGFRSVAYDSVQAITRDKGFYYKRYMDSLLRATQVTADKSRQRKAVDMDGGFDFFKSIFGIIFWIAAIGLFGYLVYRLFLSNSSFFSRNRKNIAVDIQLATEDSNDPGVMLRNAIKNGNYRLAVRYLYLQALHRLSEKKFIEINANKTNYEYVNETRKHKFANEFASLTLQYEYVWYGEYPLDEKLFRQIEEGFLQFNKNYTR